MTKKQQAMTIIDEQAFPMLAAGHLDTVATLLETVSRFELLPIQTPQGGGLLWQFPGLHGEVEGAATFDAVICVIKGKQKKFWEYGLDDEEGQRGPPQCVSVDSINGYGDPGGECTPCPNNAWGSAERGKGRRCQDHALAYLFREGGRMPHLLSIPATSLKSMGRYMMEVADRGLNLYQVTTRLGLEAAKSATGYDYARITFAIGGVVEGEAALANAKAMRDALKTFADQADLQSQTSR